MPLHLKRAFTLIELAIVLLVSTLMLNFVLGTMQASNPVATAECVNDTRFKLNYIRAQIEAFARKNDRLPLPAARNLGVDAVTYGRENSGANIDAAAGVSFGALPWQALGIPSDYAGDCWGNKFTYMVTTALTTSASSGGYLDSTVVGNITLKKAAATNVNTAIAYAVISHGEDGLGAVKLNWSAANAADGPPDSAHRWCSGSTDIAYTNCLATAATVMDAPFNNGKDAGTAYFDDIVMAGVRPKILTTPIFTWGYNFYGQRGNGIALNFYKPTAEAPALPSGVTNFTAIDGGLYYSCAIANTGVAYCWSGRNIYGQVGDGTTTNYRLPTAVTMPAGVTSFTSISTSSGGYTSCAIANTGAAYCWGAGFNGAIGDGATSHRYVPTAVTMPAGVTSFTSISMGSSSTSCAIANTGAAYCWGYNFYGHLGDNTTTDSSVPIAVIMPSGISAFSRIVTGGYTNFAW